MWSVSHGVRTSAPAEAVWALWEDPARWAEWNPEIVEASLDGPFALGGRATIRFRRGRPLTFTITALERPRLFTDETRLPGATMGHEHRIEAGELRHTLYLEGPLARVYALLLGRRMRREAASFAERELAIVGGR